MPTPQSIRRRHKVIKQYFPDLEDFESAGKKYEAVKIGFPFRVTSYVKIKTGKNKGQMRPAHGYDYKFKIIKVIAIVTKTGGRFDITGTQFVPKKYRE